MRPAIIYSGENTDEESDAQVSNWAGLYLIRLTDIQVWVELHYTNSGWQSQASKLWKLELFSASFCSCDYQ